MTRRRWIASQWTASSASLEGDQAAHLVRVLRAQVGMRFDVVAGGHVFLAEITAAAADHVEFALLQELSAEAALKLTVLLSIFRFERFEWAVEKAVELGIQSIQPIIARRSEKHLVLAANKRVERWRRIAREAAQQSRRAEVPEVGLPLDLKNALATVPDTAFRILLSETEQDMTLHSSLMTNADRSPDVVLAIGPEGGWTPEEMALFSAAQWKPVTLGDRILRVETAAIAAISIAGAVLGARREAEGRNHEGANHDG